MPTDFFDFLEKRYPERFKILLIFSVNCALSGLNWLIFVPLTNAAVITFDEASKDNNNDNLMLNYCLLFVYPILFLLAAYLIEKVGIKLSLIIATVLQILSDSVHLILQ